MKYKIGFFTYYLTIILIMLFGIIYMVRPTFMPYHARIVHLNWEQIPETEQILVRALMIAVGGVTISIGIILGLFIYKFQKTGLQWVSNLVMASGIIASILISIAPLFVVLTSDSVPPLYIPVIIIALFITGNMLTRRKK